MQVTRTGQNVLSCNVVENYNGSIYIIQGMQDWNVDPHMAFPAHQIVEAAGIETKTLAGQWAHDYPDRKSGHEALPSGEGAEAYPYTLRWDWADEMLYWFDWYLKGEGRAPTLGVEMQDNRGGWRDLSPRILLKTHTILKSVRRI